MFWEIITPILISFASIVVPTIATLGYAKLEAWTGIEIEAKHREALQSALANAARIIVAKGGNNRDGELKALAYIRNSVPDALKALGAWEQSRLRELLAPHVEREQAAKAAP